MKKKYCLLALASILVLGGCSAQQSKKKSASNSQTRQSSSAKTSSSEEDVETTKKYEYHIQASGLSQTQVWEITYKGSQYKRILLTLKQSISEERAARLTDSTSRETYLNVMRGSTVIKEAQGVQGVTATVDINEQNQLVFTFDMDMQQLDIDAASKISNLGKMFSGLKDVSPTTFIKGLEALGAKEIK